MDTENIRNFAKCYHINKTLDKEYNRRHDRKMLELFADELDAKDKEIDTLMAKLDQLAGATVVEVDTNYHCTECPLAHSEGLTCCDLAVDIIDCPLRKGAVVVKLKQSESETK